MSDLNIFMNYDDTLSKASKLREIAQQLRVTTADPLQETANNLGTVWTGDAAEEYRRKLYGLGTTFRRRAATLDGFAGGLESSVERYRRVEELAKSLFGRNGS